MHVQYICVCVCVTFLPLPAAHCSLPGAEPEPPPVERAGEGEVLGYKRTQCHCVRSAPLLLHTVRSVPCLPPPPYLTSTTSMSAAPSSHSLPANLMPISIVLQQVSDTYLHA